MKLCLHVVHISIHALYILNNIKKNREITSVYNTQTPNIINEKISLSLFTTRISFLQLYQIKLLVVNL